MSKDEIIEKLRDDENYYGSFGKQFLSNSDIYTLLNNPLAFGTPSEPNINFLLGGYFHTAILEPGKLEKYKIIEASTRNTNIYKEAAKDGMCLLTHEVEKIKVSIDTMMSNEICRGLIKAKNVDYEVPGIAEIFGKKWKGKADILNHSEKLIIDLKTTSSLSDFKYSAKKYNYDSQAYIYKQLFGYDMVYVAIDKITNQIGIYDCSSSFLKGGEDKVLKAIETYSLFKEDPAFKRENYFINETL